MLNVIKDGGGNTGTVVEELGSVNNCQTLDGCLEICRNLENRNLLETR